MKNLFQIFISVLLVSTSPSVNSQTQSSLQAKLWEKKFNVKQEKFNGDNCLSNEYFNLVKSYISENGVDAKLYKTGIITDTITLSLQIFLNNKTLSLIDYKNFSKIIIIDNLNKDKIPVYFVSNESEPCNISAYYSRFDTDEIVKNRNDDWCEIVNQIRIIKSQQ